MKLLRYLKEVDLVKSVNTKQANGQYIKTFTPISTYNVLIRNLEDEVNATIYGANIDKMLSISDALGKLYTYLMPKVDNEKDNISLYFVEIDNVRYKIVSVKQNNIKIERIGTIDSNISL